MHINRFISATRLLVSRPLPPYGPVIQRWRAATLLVCSGAIIVTLILSATTRLWIVGGSMEPSLLNGDRVLAIASFAHWSDPQRGEIVSFLKSGADFDQVKRVVGMPGETVTIKDGRVWINQHPLLEPYVSGQTESNSASIQLAQDQYFLMGDHRALSRDSRNFGPVRRSEILGRAIFVCWPWSHVRRLDRT